MAGWRRRRQCSRVIVRGLRVSADSADAINNKPGRSAPLVSGTSNTNTIPGRIYYYNIIRENASINFNNLCCTPNNNNIVEYETFGWGRCLRSLSAKTRSSRAFRTPAVTEISPGRSRSRDRAPFGDCRTRIMRSTIQLVDGILPPPTQYSTRVENPRDKQTKRGSFIDNGLYSST